MAVVAPGHSFFLVEKTTEKTLYSPGGLVVGAGLLHEVEASISTAALSTCLLDAEADASSSGESNSSCAKISSLLGEGNKSPGGVQMWPLPLDLALALSLWALVLGRVVVNCLSKTWVSLVEKEIILHADTNRYPLLPFASSS
jgi:hypothetical protein